MDIQTRKIEFIREFLKVDNEKTISRLEKLIQAEKLQGNKDLEPLSIEEVNERIDKSSEDSKRNRLTKSNALITEIEEWG